MNGRTNGLYDGLLTGQANGLFDGLGNGLHNGLFNNDIVNDFDAQNFINATSSLNQQQQYAIKWLVLNLKSYAIWDKMITIYPFIGGTANSHKYNLKNPLDTDAAYRLVFTGGWTHSLTGAKPNGTNAYADTKLNCTILGTSHAFGIYSRTTDSSGSRAYGCYDGSFLQNNILSANFISGAISNVINYTANGKTFLMASRTNSNFFEGFVAGKSVGNSQFGMGAMPNLNFHLAARRDAGLIQFYISNEHAFAFISKGLSAKESINLYQIVQGYQTLLNRAV